MILAQISSFGTKKITDRACTTSGSGHHGLYWKVRPSRPTNLGGGYSCRMANTRQSARSNPQPFSPECQCGNHCTTVRPNNVIVDGWSSRHSVGRYVRKEQARITMISGMRWLWCGRPVGQSPFGTIGLMASAVELSVIINLVQSLGEHHQTSQHHMRIDRRYCSINKNILFLFILHPKVLLVDNQQKSLKNRLNVQRKSQDRTNLELPKGNVLQR